MERKFVNLLKQEQQGMVNDAIWNLARLRQDSPEKFKQGWKKITTDNERGLSITFHARWLEDEKVCAKDEILISIKGIVTLHEAPRAPREATLPDDSNTALVDSVTVNLKEGF